MAVACCSIFNTRRVVVRTLIIKVRECTYREDDLSMTISCEGEMKDVTPMNIPSTTGWSLND